MNFRKVLKWLDREWIVKANQAFRKDNRAADWLANHSFSLTFGNHIWSSPPPGLLKLLRYDDMGVALPHLSFH